MSKQNPHIVTVERLGKDYIVNNLKGTPVAFTTDKTSKSGSVYIPSWRLDKAAKGAFPLQEYYNSNDEVEWRQYKGVICADTELEATENASMTLPMAPVFNLSGTGSFLPSVTSEISITAPVIEDSHEGITEFIRGCYAMKPEYLKMKELKWKYMVRSALRGRNIMIVGDSGAGKTLAAVTLPRALGRPFEIFPIGATQDPRSFLIGNTHLDQATGTFFDESLFVKMIQIPNAIIVLDEFTRADPEAHNILMSVLDINQRYLRIEEAVGTRTIKVAPGVTFVATSNIGNEFVNTRVMDKATFERWIVIEMDLLTDKEEAELLTYLYPMLSVNIINSIASLAHITRVEMGTDACKLRHPITTRMSVETAGLMFDGFKLQEACEAAIMPFFEKEGGTESERTYILQAVQKYVDVADQGVVGSGTVVADMFSQAEISKAPK